MSEQRRFCPACGCAWQAAWSLCPVCSQGAADAPVAPTPRGGAPRIARPLGVALGLYFALLAAILITPQLDVPWSLVVGDLAIAGLALGFSLATWRALPLGWPASRRAWLVAPLLGAGTWALAELVVTGLHAGFQIPLVDAEMIEAFGALGPGPMLLSMVVLPAVFEELAFRGVILAALREVLDDREAIAVQALLFATLHLSIPSMIHLGVLGAALGALCLRVRSLLPCMVVHAVHNGLVVLTTG